MTDPTGRAFISYRRTRTDETAILVAALDDRGVPVWQDTRDLRAEPTADEIKRILGSPETSCGIPIITADVKESAVITKIELPGLLKRHDRGDGFFLQGIVAGGLGYAEAGAAASTHLGMEDLATWNLLRAAEDPASEAEIVTWARTILRRRIAELHARRPLGEPVRARLFTRRDPGFAPGWWASIDWSRRFDGRTAPASVWDEKLLPALADFATSVARDAPGRTVEVSGQCSLAAAFALGAALPSPSGVPVEWRQTKPGRKDQLWSLNAPDEPMSSVEFKSRDLMNNSQDIALIVSVAQSVEEAVGASKQSLPTFRGTIRVQGTGGEPIDVASPGHAAWLARAILAEVNRVRSDWRDIRRLHLFLAGPAGLATLLGQLSNGLGPVQTYEHVPSDAVGRYEPAALVTAGLGS